MAKQSEIFPFCPGPKFENILTRVVGDGSPPTELREGGVGSAI